MVWLPEDPETRRTVVIAAIAAVIGLVLVFAACFETMTGVFTKLLAPKA